MKQKFVLLVSVFIAVVWGSVANAQYAMEPTWSPPDYLAHYNNANNPVVNRQIENGRRQTQTQASNSSVSSRAMAATAAVTTQPFEAGYIPSMSRRAANNAALLRRMRAVDASSADQIAPLLTSNEVFEKLDAIMPGLGLKPNNVAHAYAMYWIAFWNLANKNYETPAAKTMSAVASQAAETFATDAVFSAMDDAAKQKVAEEFLIFALILDASLEQTKGNVALADQMAAQARQVSRRSGLNLVDLTLTEEGFRPIAR